MRASLHCDVALRRSWLWPILVGSVAAAALASIAAWAAARPGEASAASMAAVPLAMLGVVLVALAVARTESGRLRLDGSSWTFAPDRARGAAAATGRLDVAIDIGAFMLLRFVADGTRRGGRGQWLPVTRAALPHDWHALRCAVYSPRPAQAPGASGANLPPE